MVNSKVDNKKVDSKKPGKQPGSPKTGGRVKGTPNKRSLAFSTVLEDADFSIPDKAMELYKTTSDDNLRFKLLEFMASYSNPKIKDKDMPSEDEPTAQDEQVSSAQILNMVDTKK